MSHKIFELFKKHYRLEIRDAVDESVLAEIFKWREYRCADSAIVAAKIIVDVGAHIGLFSLYCRTLNSQAKIYALEPEPDNLKTLRENINKNKLRVNAIGAALAGKTGQRRLILTGDNHNHHLAPAGSNDETAIIVDAFRLSGFAKKNEITRIDLLKLDIEGGEYGIIESLSSAEFMLVKHLICEYHGEEKNRYRGIESRLRENGFSVSVFPSRFDSKLGFIFARNKRLN